MSNKLKNKRGKHESENEDDPEPFESSGDEWDAEKAEKEKNGRRKSSRMAKKPKRAVVDESGSDKDEFSDEEFFDEKPKGKGGAKKTKAAKPTPKKQKVKDSEEEGSDDEEEGEQPKKKKPGPKKGAAKPAAKKQQKPKTSEEDEEDEESEEENEESGSENEDSGSDGSTQRNNKALPKTIYSEDYAIGSFVILKKDAEGGAKNLPVIWRIDGKALLQKFEAFEEDDKVRHKNTSIYTGWSPLDQEMYGPLTVDVISHHKSSLIVEVHWDEVTSINADSD